MNSLIQHHELLEQDFEKLAGGEKPSWQRPELTLLGRLGDFVQGKGKVGSTFDSDPQGSRKSGAG